MSSDKTRFRHRGIVESRDAKHAYTVLKLAQLSVRMHNERLLDAAKRSQDGQKKRFKDTLKASLKHFNTPKGLGNTAWMIVAFFNNNKGASSSLILKLKESAESAKPESATGWKAPKA